MSTGDRIPDDADLLAFVEGRLDADARRTVEAALARDPDLARRVAAMQVALTEEPGLLDAVLDAPLPDRLRQAARGADVRRRRGRLSLLAAQTRDFFDGVGWRLGGPAVAAAAGLLIGLAIDGEAPAPPREPGYRPAESESATSSATLPPAALDALVSTLESGGESARIGDVEVTLGQLLPLPVDAQCRWFSVTADGVRHGGIACARPPGWSVMSVETSTIADDGE